MKRPATALLSLTVSLLLAYPATPKPPTFGWGATVSTPGHYRLVSDLSGVGTAITITADHVVLDLDGHSIAGQGITPGRHDDFLPAQPRIGVLVQNASNVQIKNGTINSETL